MDLISLITDEEKKYIDYYRDTYGIGNQEPTTNMLCSCEKCLYEWNNHKEDLFHLLGDKLIISFPVEFNQASDEIRTLLDDYSDEWYSLPFARKFRRWADTLSVGDFTDCALNDLWDKAVRIRIADLVSSSQLSTGITDDYDIKFSNGLNIAAGTRILRALRRINDKFDIAPKEEYDEFSQAISVYFNQRKLKGTFNLSIHPLDYMTMSDNNSDWSSCMSWMENGCYRRGTVEMMNSPYAVVGYLTASKPFYLGGHRQWNNKKWRVLYLVTPELITSIKSYPYFNEELTKAGLNKLKSLSKNDYNDEIFKTEENYFSVDEENSHVIEFETNTMYNDFGSSTIHFFYPNKTLINAKKNRYNYINYSGPSTCIWCGNTTSSCDYEGGGDEETTSLLICNNCDKGIYCTCCGDRINSYDACHTVDGAVCRCCFKNEYEWNEIEQDYIKSCDTYEVYLATKREDGTTLMSPFWFKAADVSRYGRAYDLFTSGIHKDNLTHLYYAYVEELDNDYSIAELCGTGYDSWEDYKDYFFIKV